MSHLKLKQLAGPSNGARGGIIVFDNTSASWSTDLSTALTLPSGTTEQRPQTPSTGMLRFNTSTSGVEVHTGSTWKRIDADLSIYLQRYVFRMEYTSDQKVGVISNLPANWSVVQTNNTDFTIEHGLGRPPAGGYMYGQVTPPNGTQYQMRNFSSAVEIEYDSTNQNRFQIRGITSSSFIGTPAGGHVYFHIYI